jgi:DNA-directed RNA polymerase subunit H
MAAIKKKSTFNIKDHILIPEHSKLTEKDKKKFLEKYGVSKNNISRILISDKSIAHLSLKPGEIIKIVRPSPTNNESLSYRVVIDE